MREGKIAIWFVYSFLHTQQAAFFLLTQTVEKMKFKFTLSVKSAKLRGRRNRSHDILLFA